MVKKFKEWWNQLTSKQQVIMLVIIGIVDVVLLYLCIMNLESSDSVGISFIGCLGLTILLCFLIFNLLSIIVGQILKAKDEKLLKRYEGKLSQDEITEVFFKSEIQAPPGRAGEWYWDNKHCEEPHWFAKWQDDQIYVELKDNDKKVRDWCMDLSVLDFYFNIDRSSCENDR